MLTTGHLANQHTFFFFFFVFFFFFFVLAASGEAKRLMLEGRNGSQRICWPNRKGGKRNEQTRRRNERRRYREKRKGWERRRKRMDSDGGRRREGVQHWGETVQACLDPLSFSNKEAVPHRPVAVNRYYSVLHGKDCDSRILRRN